MNKSKILLILFFYILTNILLTSNEAPKKDLIKRKIAILPFHNESNLKEFDYLEGIIRDALRAKLQDKNLFLFANFSDVDEKIKGTDRKELVNNEDTIVKTVLKVNADVALVGKYAIINDKIMIIANAIDILNKQSITSATVSGNTGVELFNLIEDLAVKMSDKMAASFPMVEKSLLDQLIEKQQKQYNISKDEKTIKEDKKEETQKDKNKESKRNDPDYKKFTQMLAGGIVCISIGAVVIIIGGVILGVSGLFNGIAGLEIINSVLIGVGSPILAIGCALALAGIIIAPLSVIFYRKWKKKQQSNYITPILDISLSENFITAGVSIRM